MKNLSEKFIALLIALSLITGLCFNVFIFKSKTAKATDGGGALMNFIKETGLDAIASSVASMMIKKLEQNVYDWGMGRKSKINLPFTISDMSDYLDEAVNRATGGIIEKLKLTDLCEPIAYSFGERFRYTFTVPYQDRPSYETYAGCSLNTVINNVGAFIKNPRITIYGWDAWRALTTPKNNVFGSFFLAQDLKIDYETRAEANAKQKATQNQGYRDETNTSSTNKEECIQTCQESYSNCLNKTANSGTTNLSSNFSLSLTEPAKTYFGISTSLVSTQPSAIDLTGACASSRDACIQNTCENMSEIPTKVTVSTAGMHIAELMKNALSLESDRLAMVDEITELVGVFFQALINKATSTGLQTLANATQQATLVQKSRVINKDTYGYLRAHTKTNTTQKKKDARAKLVTGMDTAVKKLTRSIINCGEKEIMHLEEFAKNVDSILESNVEALYVSIQGINLKSGAVVLDPPYAPYSVYGYSWGEVFPSKVPDKCRGILNQMNLDTNTNCTDIISGLEPMFGQTFTTTTRPQCNDGIDNDGDGLIDFPADPGCSSLIDNSEFNTSGGGKELIDDQAKVVPMIDLIPGFGENTCLPCMYDHDALNCPIGPTPPQPYPGTSFLGIGSTGTVWTTAILQQKQQHYDGCHEWYDVTLDRCEECTKAYDSKCSRLKTEELKNRCLERYCNNYADISDHVIDPPDSPFDFYNKCLIEEQKSACFACLMEHYIPATYCEQTKDYIARMIIKYPAVVKLVRTGDNKGQFLGLFDQTIADMGKECDDNWARQNISLALICRILPEFSFNGVKRCRTDCFRAGMTNAQLLDITDFRPDENDCGNIKLDVGGKEPFFAMDDGILESRGICCADFWQKSRKQYAICIGAGPTTGEPDTTPISNFACTLSADPVSGLAPLNDVDLTISVTGLYSGNEMTYQFDCNDDGTPERTENNIASGTTFTTTIADLCDYPETNTTYTASAVAINEFGNSVSCRTSVQTTDCEVSSVLNPESGIVPVSTNITGRLNNAVAGPFTFTFYCNVPTSGGSIDTWSGATTPHTSDTAQYTLNNACNFTTGGTKGIGVSILNNSTNTTSSCYQTIRVSDNPSIACDAQSLNSFVSPNTPVDLMVEAMPNSSYISLIHNSVGTNFSYDCYNSGFFNDYSTTINDLLHQSSVCSYSSSGTYTIGVRVGNINPANGFSAYSTCRATINVQSTSGEPLP